jgi:hypothetical protein
MMNVSRIHERLSGKLKSFLTLIKRVFRLPLRFKANLHTDITSVGQDTGETGQMSRKASKRRRKKKIQHQIDVGCPIKIRKRILKNMRRAASVSRVSPTRAKIARELLIKLKKTGSLANFQPKSNPVRKDNLIEVTEPVLEVTERPLRAKEFVHSMFGKVKAGFASVRQRFCFGFGTNHVNQPVAS